MRSEIPRTDIRNWKREGETEYDIKARPGLVTEYNDDNTIRHVTVKIKGV
jgi:hypothetical protein